MQITLYLICMKRALITFLGVLFCVYLMAQGPAIQWQKAIGWQYRTVGNCIIQTRDSGYISVGFTSSTDSFFANNHGEEDLLVVKLNYTGNIEWVKLLGSTKEDIAYSVCQTTDGGYIIAGSTKYGNGDVSGFHGNGISEDCWIVKLDSIGNIQWERAYGGTAKDIAYSIYPTNDNGYIFTGVAESEDGDLDSLNIPVFNRDRIWTVKLDSAGNIQWQKLLQGADGKTVIQIASGEYIVGGTAWATVSTHDLGEYGVFKLDSAGNVIWQKAYGGNDIDILASLESTNDGGYILAGKSGSNNGDINDHICTRSCLDYWIVKIDSAGLLQWTKSLGGFTTDAAWSLKQTRDGEYIAAGMSLSNDNYIGYGQHGDSDYWIVKLNTNGTRKWSKFYGGADWDEAHSIIPTFDGGYIVVGYEQSHNMDINCSGGDGHMWIVKLEPCFAYYEMRADGTLQNNWQAVVKTDGQAPVTYQWNWQDGNTSSGALATHTYSNKGFYNPCLTITDAAGCTTTYCSPANYSSSTDSMRTINTMFQYPTQPLTTSHTVQNVLCYGDSSGCITVNATYGLSPYHFTVDGVTNANGDYCNFAAGMHYITVTDALNNTVFDSAFVASSTLLSSSFQLSGDTVCPGNIVEVTSLTSGGVAPYTYTYNLPGAEISSGDTGVFHLRAAGILTVTAQDFNGCTVTNYDTVYICPVGATYAIQHAKCYGSANGCITVTGNGGVPYYTYACDGRISYPPIFCNLAAGYHYIMVRDAANTTFYDTVLITSPSSPVTSSFQLSANSVCPGDSVQLTLSAGGGTPPYKYQFSYDLIYYGPSTTNNILALYQPDTIEIRTIDSNLCYSVNQVIISACNAQNCDAKFSLHPDPLVPHNWFALNQATGVGVLSYTWYWGDGTSSTGATPSHVYSAPGYYNICLTITDANNCTHSYCDSSTYIYKTDATISVNVVTELPTGVIEPIANNQFIFYPNPGNNQLTVCTDNVVTGAQINIYDIASALLQTQKFDKTPITIDTSNLPAGVYVVEVKTKTESIKRRWIKS
jgi:hypothetical protein